MRRRRAASKEPTADEQLDAMLEAAREAQPKRAQSLEPSRTRTPSLKRTSYAAVTNTPGERRAVEGQRQLPAPEDARELGPRGPPQVFMPMVLLQPVQEQAWGMLAGLEQPYPGMWGNGGSMEQMPVALQGRREELSEGVPLARGPGGVEPREKVGGGERVLEETKGSVKSSPLNPWSAEKLREGFGPFGKVWGAGGVSVGNEQAAVVDRYKAHIGQPQDLRGDPAGGGGRAVDGSWNRSRAGKGTITEGSGNPT